jgi:hypothetical protein
MRPITLLVLTMSLLMYGCRKSNTTGNNSPTSSSTPFVDSISYSSCNYAGDIITFHYVFQGSLSIHSSSWDFGDGGSSGEHVEAHHIYSNPGTYTVTCQINGKTLTRQVEIVQYPDGSLFTDSIDGNRTWTGTAAGMIFEFSSIHTSGQTIPIDTQFAIKVMNDGIIWLPFYNSNGLTLNLSSSDSSRKMLTFTDCQRSTAMLRYYYDRDSIVYTNYWTYGKGWESFVLHSP